MLLEQLEFVPGLEIGVNRFQHRRYSSCESHEHGGGIWNCLFRRQVSSSLTSRTRRGCFPNKSHGCSEGMVPLRTLQGSPGLSPKLTTELIVVNPLSPMTSAQERRRHSKIKHKYYRNDLTKCNNNNLSTYLDLELKSRG